MPATKETRLSDEHALRRNADTRRDRTLGAAGFRVLCLPASLVTSNLPAALKLLTRALRG